MLRRLLLALALTGPLAAAPYRNATFHYGLDLPAGWSVKEGSPDGELVLASRADPSLTFRITAVAKPGAMPSEEAARLVERDLAAIAGKAAAHRAAALPPYEMGGELLDQHGLAYRLAKDAPARSLRLMAGSWKVGAEHVWLKLSIDGERDRSKVTAKDVDHILQSLSFSPASEAAAASPSPSAAEVTEVTATTGSSDETAQRVEEAKQAYEAVRETPAGDTSDADALYGQAESMSAEEVEAHNKAFEPTAQERNEAEKARARALMGGIGNK